MNQLQTEQVAEIAAQIENAPIESLGVAIMSAQKRAESGWARADSNHRVPGVSDPVRSVRHGVV